jgi:hypothetical protein
MYNLFFIKTKQNKIFMEMIVKMLLKQETKPNNTEVPPVATRG